MTRKTFSPLALAITASLLAPLTHAQSHDNGDRDTRASSLDAVIVTGTRGAERTVQESTSPIDVLDAEDLRRAGVLNGELGSALQVLLPSFNFPRQSNSGGADHVRAAQLRGLSPDQVLVLVNGKRRHHSALVNTDSKIGKGTTPVDFNAIPVSAIARIEVLRDGAGALYGSDAVAGVINVILDERTEGGSIEATWGAHHTRLAPIDQRLTDGQTGQLTANVGTTLGNNGGFLRVGGEFKQRNPTNRAGFDQVPPWDQSPTNLAVQGRRNYVLGDGESQDLNAWFNAGIPLNEQTELYAFGTFNQRDSEGANYYRYPDSSATWAEVYPDGYRPVSIGENRDLQLVAGARGQWRDWGVDASLDHGRNDFTYRLRNSLNASLGPNSPTRFKTGDYQYQQTTANLDLARVFVPSTGPSHSVGLGLEARLEDYRTGAGDPASYAAGPYTDRPTGSQAGGGLTPQDEADLDRQVLGAYASLSTSFDDIVSTDLAARYEHIEGYGSQFTGKAGARWQFTPAFGLRGALSSNFRAPSLAQIGYESTSTGYTAGGQLVQGRLLSVNNPIARDLGAQDLSPEKSLNLSLGLTGRIGEHLDLSLDLFEIRIDDRIALSESLYGDGLTTWAQTTHGVSGLESVHWFVNAADTRTRGAEFVANWRQELGNGQLLLTGTWAWAKTTLRNLADTPEALLALDPSYQLIGVEESNTLTEAAPRTRGSLAASWDNARWGLSTRLQRHGSATRVFNFGGGYEPRQTYGAEWQLDAEVEFRASDSWSLAIGGQNLTDNYPDRSNEDIHYFGNLPYDVLSPLGSNGRYVYGRVRYRF